MTVRVALYARVSTKGQDTDNQMLRLREHAERHGYEVIGEFVDVASGANAHRPELDRMLALAKSKRIDRVLATKLDRLARSVINLSLMMADLEAWGIGVELIDQPINTATPSGRLTTVVLAAVAEFERELIRERTMDGLARAKAEGKKSGRPRKELSDYQIAKLKRILEDDPNISQRRLASQFDGIGSTALIERAKELGLLGKRDEREYIKKSMKTRLFTKRPFYGHLKEDTMHTVSTIEARNRKDASYASEAQAMTAIEEFIARTANRASWEVRYTGPDREFTFTSTEWEALEAERQQDIKDDESWNDRVKFWHGNRHHSEDLKKKKEAQEGQTFFDDDKEGPDWL